MKEIRTINYWSVASQLGPDSSLVAKAKVRSSAASTT
jgi:hypothetical protein